VPVEIRSKTEANFFPTNNSESTIGQDSIMHKKKAWEDLGWSSVFHDNGGGANLEALVNKLKKDNRDLRDVVEFFLRNFADFESKFVSYEMRLTMDENLDEGAHRILLGIKETIDNIKTAKMSDKFRSLLADNSY
jgi:hypothetical protein